MNEAGSDGTDGRTRLKTLACVSDLLNMRQGSVIPLTSPVFGC